MPARTRARVAAVGGLDNDAANDESIDAGPSQDRSSDIVQGETSRINIVSGNGDEESEDDAPEEESNTTSKSVIRDRDEKRRVDLKEKQEARRKAAASRQQRNEQQRARAKTQQSLQESIGAEEGTSARSSLLQTSDSSKDQGEQQQDRLDPALFASAFARPVGPSDGHRALSSTADKRASSSKSVPKGALDRAAQKRRREKRRGGIVEGRDGQPMRRVDGNTVVRVLPSDAAARRTNGHHGTQEEVLVRAPAISDVEARPNAKARAFKKRRLGLQGTQGGDRRDTSRAAVPKISGKPRAKRPYSEDDPLGLEDPAFMKGGEFEGLGLPSGNKRKRSRGGKSPGQGAEKRRVSELRGADAGRRTGIPAISRNGSVMNFVRH